MNGPAAIAYIVSDLVLQCNLGQSGAGIQGGALLIHTTQRCEWNSGRRHPRLVDHDNEDIGIEGYCMDTDTDTCRKSRPDLRPPTDCLGELLA
ncbi:hypothetical protein HYALB_00007073 [Hymenoscyphus albidus]|uniref:Uncharacterized protein n=1 Tax=Hymenoscyphus albidus TaxID=595503 RepID=A0A9N9LMT5_9HELO|nr:hypothetical protein HYALB_00007073 [Hymenoscyphus albidus]